MRLVLLHGPPASGKLTIARIVAERTGHALFHNHLIVDTVTALFPFGSERFVRLRETMWRMLLTEAAAAGRDTIFTFAPEPSVTPSFIVALLDDLRAADATVLTVALTLDAAEQERRLVVEERARYGKLTDVSLLRTLRPGMARSARAMPPADLTIDSGTTDPLAAATRIEAALG